MLDHINKTYKGGFTNLVDHPSPSIFLKGGGGEDLKQSKEEIETGERHFFRESCQYDSQTKEQWIGALPSPLA